MKVTNQTSLFSVLFISTALIVLYCINKNASVADSSDETVPKRMKKPVHVTRLEMNTMRNRTDIIPGYIPLREQYYVAPDYNLSMCSIEQITPDILKKIFCYLYDLDNIINSTFPYEQQLELLRYPCISNSSLSSTKQLLEVMPNSPTMIILLKNPIERFIQSYIDICVNGKHSCLDCKQDIRCFLNKLKEMYLNQNESTDQYIYHSFAPQTWCCGVNYAFNTTIFLEYGNKIATKADLFSAFDSLLEDEVDEKKEQILWTLNEELLRKDRSIQEKRQYKAVFNYATTVDSVLQKIKYMCASDIDLYDRNFRAV